ncbi:P-loop containing nucleoside triphosphate hydrolase protein, partial [Sphaerosporella brunnea]
ADIDVDAEEDLLEENYEITEEDQPFQPGAIVRVAVKNFVTYTYAELKPGPSLNMIIGPNGTGKSSIVCAICLGLGYAPSHLGRSNEVSAFVKHGFQEAFIDIELQGYPDERNQVVRRKISRDDNKSSYWINQKQATHTAVQKLCRRFNIQIDNLCQFLPQDRVAEFANLPDTERLVQTVRAAASPQMMEYYKSLVELGKQVEGDHDVLKHDQTQLEQLEARQAVLQQDVDRMRERQEVVKKIDLLEKMIPHVRYRQSRAEYLTKKQEFAAAQQELRDLEAEVAPAMERPKHKQRYKKAIQSVIDARSRQLEEKQKQVSAHKTQVTAKLEGDVKKVKADIAGVQKSEGKRKDEIRTLKKHAEDLQKRIDAGAPAFDLEASQQKQVGICDLSHPAIRDIKAQALGVVEKAEARKTDLAQVKTQKQRAEHDQQNLDSLAGQRENLMSREPRYADTYRAWRWYQQNKDLFEKEIYAPPMLTVAAKDQRYADAVEHIIRGASTAFVCQTQEDYFKFSREIFGSKDYQGQRLRSVTIKDFSGTRAPRLQDQQRPYTREQLAAMGFDGVILDYIEGPEPVLNMLCHEAGVHVTPFSARPLTEAQNQACTEAGLNTWIHGNTATQVRRRYGSAVTTINTLAPSSIYRTQQVDPHRRAEIGRRINELKDTENEIQRELHGFLQEHNNFKARLDELNAKMKQLSDEKAKAQRAIGEYQGLQVKLENTQQKIASELEQGAQHKSVVQQLEKKLDQAVANRAQGAIEFTRLVGELVDSHNEMVTLKIRHLEALSDEKILDSQNRAIAKRVEKKTKEVGTIKKETLELQAKAKQLTATLRETLATLSDEDREKLQNLPQDKTLEDIEEEIGTERARLELIHEGNPNAMRQYEERALKITALQKKIDSLRSKLEEKDSAIKDIRDHFEPQLDNLVAKISAAFSNSFKKIGCAGEVRVNKSEEGFDKWEIQALVRFREGEKLQVLNAQRQSGGERAVSTVFYLMALQSLAKSPFRVVDEINQGMDPRNERVVHHRMVNIACQQHTSQYFLITPKLLSDLMYHTRMRIHCIYSGEWVGEDFMMDFKKYLAAGRKLK